MIPWAAAVSKSPSNTQHLLQQQQQHQQLHHNHQQHLLQQHQHQQQHHLQQQQQQQQQQHQNNLLNANNHNQNNSSFEPYTGSIGCWSLPESNNSSSRGGWNANDGILKGDGVADDGTAIWGATKKTGIDWTEKELLLNPPKANNTNSSEKRIQKTETSISSINGTEAWGAPAASTIKSTATPSNNPRNCNDSQSQLSNDNSGKNDDFGSIDTMGWGGDSSLSSRAKTVTTNENSSPSINSNNVWNISGLSKQQQPQAKASDWLAGANSSNGTNRAINQNNVANRASVRQQLEQQQQQQKGASDVVGSTTNSNQFIQSISGNSKTSPDLNASVPGNGGVSGNNNNGGNNGANIGCIGAVPSGNNNINDLKLSANYSNDLLDSPNRQLSGSVTSNNRQSQFDSAAYANNNSNSNNPTGGANTPSRDLLKQMVHQIHLAVQAGHLNAQILNQPLSTPTLQLVYQLLQQIKNLHHLQQVKANSNNSSTIDMQINRTTHNISLLHKAITQQQAAIGKNDQQQQIGGSDKQKQQQNSANNYSYATISKISTANQKVPSSANNIISNNLESFNKSSLIDSLKNDSNSDTLRAVQAKFDSTNNFDKNNFNSGSMQPSSSADNVLGGPNNKAMTVSNDFSSSSASKGQNNFMQAANHNTQQSTNNNTSSAKGNLLWAQSTSASSSSSTSSSAAWSMFNSSGDYNPQQSSWPSQLRISSNQVSQQADHHQQQQQHHQFGAFDMASDFNPGKAWSNLSDDKDNSSLAPGGNIGSNIGRPSSGAVAPNGTAMQQQKQLNGNNLLNNEESALFYDWNNDSDLQEKRNHFGQISSSSSGTTSSGLSLQSNPWLFAQNNPGNGNLIDNLVKSNVRNVGSSNGASNNNNKLDQVVNGSMNNKPILGADAFKSSASANNIVGGGQNAQHRPATSALFDWSNMTSAIQFNNSGDDASSKPQTLNSSSSTGLIGSNMGRPGPPPGLLSGNNFAQQSTQQSHTVGSNNINALFDVDSLQSRDAGTSLWSGAWLD